MRASIFLVIAACGGTTAPRAAPPATPAPAPAASPVASAAAACDTSSIQPMHDANARLARLWGDGLNGVMLDHTALVPARDGLEAAPGGEPVLVMGPRTMEWHGDPRDAQAVVLAVDAATPWLDVVTEMHEFGPDVTVRFAFAVDAHDARLADNPLRAGFDVAKARAKGADFTRRCPEAGDLFMPHDDLYDVLFGADYVAVRSVSYSPQGAAVSARRTAPFAKVAPMILAASHGAQLSVQAE
jgi:hypothetical protein